MKSFSASLLREKFVIYDPAKGMDLSQRATIALSNRFVAELRDKENQLVETYVVRAQNMHSAVRLVARVVQAFNTGGALSKRPSAFDWDKVWAGVVNDYEYAYNDERWVAVYFEGKPIYTKGNHHPLLDLIEKCDFENDKDYDYAVPLAEDLFSQKGKIFKIDHDANVALSTNFENNQARCAIIQRAAQKTTTFTFHVSPRPDKALSIPQCLGAAAAFLEGVQLAFLVGMNTQKIRIGLIPRHSKDEKQTREAHVRLERLSTEISNLEEAADVRYRPEKPDFQLILTQAEELGQKILKPPQPGETEAS
jgi:hypothetical protein